MSASFKEIEDKLLYQFKNRALVDEALTHKSLQVSVGVDNERLEFLGDAVLDLALADILMSQFPDNDEGRLSKKRASLVNEKALAELGLELGLPKHIRLGKSELQSQGAHKPRLVASCLEALVGALYLDAGFEISKAVIARIFEKLILSGDSDKDFSLDYKTRFQELIQAKDKTTPVYRLVSEEGPPHNRSFQVQVEVGGRVWAKASGPSKKMAEQAAAHVAYELFIADVEMIKIRV